MDSAHFYLTHNYILRGLAPLIIIHNMHRLSLATLHSHIKHWLAHFRSLVTGRSRVSLRSFTARKSNNQELSLLRVQRDPVKFLEADKPYDNSRLLKLPRELRDQIYDLVTADVTGVVGKGAGTKLYVWDGSLNVSSHFSSAPTGLLFSNNQLHDETMEWLDKVVPHNHSIYFGVDTDKNQIEVIMESLEPLKSRISTGAWRLSIEVTSLNGFRSELKVGRERFQNLLVLTSGFAELKELLLECTSTVYLVLTWREDGGTQMLRSQCRVAMNSLVQVIQTLPAVQRYSIEVGNAGIYARRASVETSWEDTKVTRFTQDRMENSKGETNDPLDPVTLEDEWKDLLNEVRIYRYPGH